jgi:hypothetical protein
MPDSNVLLVMPQAICITLGLLDCNNVSWHGLALLREALKIKEVIIYAVQQC